jgi:hypothetical protein
VYREAEASGINGVLNGSCGEEDEETSSPDNGNYFFEYGSVNCTRIHDPMLNSYEFYSINPPCSCV